jgi:hypothetical protein
VLSTRELTDRWAVRLGDQSLEPRGYSAAGVPAVYKRAAESASYSDEGRSRGRSFVRLVGGRSATCNTPAHNRTTGGEPRRRHWRPAGPGCRPATIDLSRPLIGVSGRRSAQCRRAVNKPTIPNRVGMRSLIRTCSFRPGRSLRGERAAGGGASAPAVHRSMKAAADRWLAQASARARAWASRSHGPAAVGHQSLE